MTLHAQDITRMALPVLQSSWSCVVSVVSLISAALTAAQSSSIVAQFNNAMHVISRLH